MFADDVRMTVERGNVKLFGQQKAKTRRIQVGAGAEHTFPRQPGQLPGDISEYVN